MDQTPAHEHHNPQLLHLIPKTSMRLIEVGCSSGALAREFKKTNPTCNYLGVDVVPEYAELARRYCDDVLTLDLDFADDHFFANNAIRDCWIFGDTLEHFRDPWAVLERIRTVIPESGCVVACIPNAQHWSVQARLCTGEFRYEDAGLLDRTHLRWFTRQTMIEMFQESGFTIVAGLRRELADKSLREKFLPTIREMAEIAGVDSDVAVNDAIPIQYVVRALPA